MTDYNSLDDATKERLREQINDCAQSLGGTNYFHRVSNFNIMNTYPFLNCI